jgi:hypothetical protein
MCEDEYAEFIHELENLPKQSDAQYDVEMGEWKKQTSHLVKLAGNIKFLVAINVVVMINILIVKCSCA